MECYARNNHVRNRIIYNNSENTGIYRRSQLYLFKYMYIYLNIYNIHVSALTAIIMYNKLQNTLRKEL